MNPDADRATVSALRRWRDIQNREREFFGGDYYPGDYVFTREDGRPPHPDTIRQRFDRLAAAAGRIGHADVAFFLQTYAYVLRNDDRDVAEQAAAFLIGDALDPPEDSAQESGASD
jgi:hypothetical protein